MIGSSDEETSQQGFVKAPVRKKRRPRESICSFSLILVCLASPSEGERGSRSSTPYFLLYQRRDSYEYIDFVRGIWASEQFLPKMFSLMTKEERQRLLSYDFDMLWDDLWVIHNCKIYRDGYERGKRKYESIKSKIPAIIESTSSSIDEPPWGFPKGKKNSLNESNIECALREFHEETHLPIETVKLLDCKPFVETYSGSNNKNYCTYYYLAECPTILPVEKIDTPQCIRKSAVSEEAADVRWLKYEEARLKLNPKRQQILKKVMEILTRKYDL